MKIDFPRVPYPKNVKQFKKLVDLGGQLRRLHLMENINHKLHERHEHVENKKSIKQQVREVSVVRGKKQENDIVIASYPEDGKNEVTKLQYPDNKVYIKGASAPIS